VALKGKIPKLYMYLIIAAAVIVAVVVLISGRTSLNNLNLSGPTSVNDSIKVYKNGKATEVTDGGYYAQLRYKLLVMSGKQLKQDTISSSTNTGAITERIKSQETAVEFILRDIPAINVVSTSDQIDYKQYSYFLIPITGTYAGKVFVSDTASYKEQPLNISNTSDVDTFTKEVSGFIDKAGLRKNDKFYGVNDTFIKKDANTAIIDYAVHKAINEHMSCDVWFGGFDRIWSYTDNAASLPITKIVGVVSVCGYNNEQNLLEFPTVSSYNARVLVQLEQQNGQFQVKTYKQVNTDNDAVWKEIIKTIPSNMQQALTTSKYSFTQANQNFANWLKVNKGTGLQVVVQGYPIKYFASTNSTSIATGLLRKSLIETGMTFIKLAANKEYSKVKALSNKALADEINLAISSNNWQEFTFAHGAEHIMNLNSIFKGFYQCNDPILSEESNVYSETIGITNAEGKTVYMQLDLVPTAALPGMPDFLVNSVKIGS